jgi:hypothetical protein
MSEDYQRLIQQVAELRRTVSNMFQVGTVKEVKGDKLRMVIGKDDQGKEVLSPWLNTANHRGGATEAKFYKKGQTLQLICPGGDIRQGSISPYAPNKDFKRPEQADSSGQDEESYQLEDYRAKQTKDGHDQWLQPDDSKKQQQGGQQQQGGGGKQQKKKGHVGGGKAKMKTRMNAGTGITNRVGTDSRVMVHKEAVKMRWDKDWVVVKKNEIIFSRPPVIKRDPIDNDDA